MCMVSYPPQTSARPMLRRSQIRQKCDTQQQQQSFNKLLNKNCLERAATHTDRPEKLSGEFMVVEIVATCAEKEKTFSANINSNRDNNHT